MHSVWLSLKTNLKCGCQKADIILRPPPDSGKEGSATEAAVRGGKGNFRLTYPQILYSEMKSGDPSRKIIEMIYQAASSCPSKPTRGIKKVIRVNNSSEKVQKFEKYREYVKMRAGGQEKMNLRSMVDGNEVLQFYSTSMNCCRNKSDKVSEPCTDITCRGCRIIQSGFSTRKNGITLSTSSEGLSEDAGRAKVSNKAVIVCRTIAGSTTNIISLAESEDYDSVKVEALCSNSGYLIVQNPSAVLPCFVVVFN